MYILLINIEYAQNIKYQIQFNLLSIKVPNTILYLLKYLSYLTYNQPTDYQTLI